jgi:hypothetical protein
MPVNTPYLSEGTTFLSNLSLSGNLAAATFSQFSSASLSRVTSQYVGLQSSIGTINPAFGTLMSWRTIAASALTVSAAATNVRVDEVVLVMGGASGASLAVYSNGTVYIFNSAVSAKYA